jgi:hypothetical protein
MSERVIVCDVIAALHWRFADDAIKFGLVGPISKSRREGRIRRNKGTFVRSCIQILNGDCLAQRLRTDVLAI